MNIDIILYICLLKKQCLVAKKMDRTKIQSNQVKKKTFGPHRPTAEFNFYHLRTNYRIVTYDLHRTKYKDQNLNVYDLSTEATICSRWTTCIQATNDVTGFNSTGINVGTNWKSVAVSVTAFGP